MPAFTDQTGQTFTLTAPPRRIISLVPSQTELLYELGLSKAVVGITSFCVHPERWFRTKTRVGGTKSVHFDRVKKLHPDLILANKEENTKEQVTGLRSVCPVWTSDVSNLQMALEMISSIGVIIGTAEKAEAIVEKIRTRFSRLLAAGAFIKTVYLIWQRPYMTVGGGTFINDMLTRCGFDNVFMEQQRYPVITIEDIRRRDCRLLFLSSEPYPFKEKHVAELQRQLPSTRIMLVDGEMFSWYGSRLLLAPDYFAFLLNELKDLR